MPSTFPWGWDCHGPAAWKEEIRPSESVLGVPQPQDVSADMTLTCIPHCSGLGPEAGA